MAEEISTLIFKVQTEDLKKGSDALDKVGGSAKKAASSLDTYEKQTISSERATRQLSQRISNVSNQIQDFAVQTASGTSAVTAMGQQLPQLLGAFGTAGVVAGTVVALSAAIGGPLVKSLFDSTAALKEFEKAAQSTNSVLAQIEPGIQRITAEFINLQRETRLGAAATIKSEIEKTNEEMRLGAAAAKEVVDRITELKRITNEPVSPGLMGRLNIGSFFATPEAEKQEKEAQKAIEQFKKIGESASKSNVNAIDLADTIDKIYSKLESPTPAFTKIRDDARDLAEKLRVAKQRMDDLQAINAPVTNAGGSFFERRMAKDQPDLVKDPSREMRKQEQASRDMLELQKEIDREIDERETKLASIDPFKYFNEEQEARIKADQDENDYLERQLEKYRKHSGTLLEQQRKYYDDLRKLADRANQKNIISDEELSEVKSQIKADEEAKERARLNRELAVKQNAKDQMYASELNFGNAIAELIGRNHEQNSAAAKVAFAIERSMAVARQIISANTAAAGIRASAAMMGMPLAAVETEANMVRTMGYAEAAITAGMAIGELAARKDGGQMLPGKSYLVGEQGPEILNLGSQSGFIRPNGELMGDSKPVSVTTNVQIVGGSADTKVTKTRRQIDDRRFVEDIVVDILGNQSHRGRAALHSTSNVQPRGRV